MLQTFAPLRLESYSMDRQTDTRMDVRKQYFATNVWVINIAYQRRTLLGLQKTDALAPYCPLLTN